MLLQAESHELKIRWMRACATAITPERWSDFSLAPSVCEEEAPFLLLSKGDEGSPQLLEGKLSAPTPYDRRSSFDLDAAARPLKAADATRRRRLEV